MNPSWVLNQVRNGAIAAVALHDGHDVRQEVADLMVISEADRWREEDPFTAAWTTIADTQIVVKRSRFELDLNRSREKAVYINSRDAWGLKVWRSVPPPEIIARSLAEYDAFYANLERVFRDLERRHGRFVVFELHTYNHRRLGQKAEPADPKYNPEINLGTATLDRDRWHPVIDSFLADLRNFDYLGRKLDVRENIKFYGGHFPTWVHQKFPNSACVLSIEVKKFFMDEWTNEVDIEQLEAIRHALQSTVPGILEQLAIGDRNFSNVQ